MTNAKKALEELAEWMEKFGYTNIHRVARGTMVTSSERYLAPKALFIPPHASAKDIRKLAKEQDDEKRD